MSLTSVNAISAMVAPVVLLTVGGLVTNGLLTVYSDVNDRMREMTRERIEILTGPTGEELEPASVAAMSRERLEEIRVQIPMMMRRHRLTRLSVLTIYCSIALLGLSIVVIAIAVGQDDEIAGRVALSLVLAGTVVLLLGIGIAGLSLAKSADAITYAVERTQSLDRLSRSRDIHRYLSAHCVAVADVRLQPVQDRSTGRGIHRSVAARPGLPVEPEVRQA
jgi:hypothetical protein